jgi:hypothetical protein
VRRESLDPILKPEVRHADRDSRAIFNADGLKAEATLILNRRHEPALGDHHSEFAVDRLDGSLFRGQVLVKDGAKRRRSAVAILDQDLTSEPCSAKRTMAQCRSSQDRQSKR